MMTKRCLCVWWASGAGAQTGKWVAADDVPPASPPDYIGKERFGHRSTVPPERLAKLDNLTDRRGSAIAADQAAEQRLTEAARAHGDRPTPHTKEALEVARAEHKPLHHEMTKSSEDFGEAIAAEHAIPEHYPDATDVTVKGSENGNYQFDQVWERPDGRYVVVEAKSSKSTQLNSRTLLNGERVSQGTREYFQDILEYMRKRGYENPDELRLTKKLRRALEAGKVDYVLVKGDPTGGKYGGYSMKQFDIGDGRGR